MKPKTARSWRSLFVEVSQRRGRANEPSLPFFFLHRVSPAPAITFIHHSFFYLCTLVLILFVLSAGTPRPSRSVFRVSLDLASPSPFPCPSRRPFLAFLVSRLGRAISLCFSFLPFRSTEKPREGFSPAGSPLPLLITGIASCRSCRRS